MRQHCLKEILNIPVCAVKILHNIWVGDIPCIVLPVKLQQMIRNEPVQGVASVSKIIIILRAVSRIRFMIDLLGKFNQVLDRIDPMPVIDTVRFNKRRIFEIPCFREYGILPLIAGMVIDTYSTGIAARCWISFVFVTFERIIQMGQDQRLIEQRNG